MSAPSATQGPADSTTIPSDATTTTAAVTTTTAAVTTTTAAGTTTTTVPASTTTRPPRTTTTTTTVPATTTTTVPATSGSSTPWGLIVLAIVLALALVAAILGFVRSRHRAQAAARWRSQATLALEQGKLARQSLLSERVDAGDAAHQEAIKAQTERAAAALTSAAALAADDHSRDATLEVADGLRGLMFALEANALLRSGPRPPTGDQLAEADAVERSRAAQLDQAVAELERRIAEGK